METAGRYSVSVQSIWLCRTPKVLISSAIITSIILYLTIVNLREDCSEERRDNYTLKMDFENFDNISGTPSGVYIVPNVVHFIRFGKKNMTFMEAVCVLAALKNQRPDKLVIHADYVEQEGKYWDVVAQHPLAQGVLEVRFLRQPTSVFGQELSKEWMLFHAGDVARLEVLMAEGGIFLDNDSYIVRSLNAFRRYEMTLGWMQPGGISNQVIIAHKGARFLVEWYNNYKAYNKLLWFYNAGERPTEILKQKPYLVHRVRRLMAEYGERHSDLIMNLKSDAWKMHYAIHLLIRWMAFITASGKQYPVVYNEHNILDRDTNIKAMALDVYPFPSRTKNITIRKQ